MKKVISLILIFMLIVSVSFSVFATNVLDGDDAETITGEQYDNAQKDEDEDKNDEDETDKDTENNETTLPQTGVENFGLGILLFVCAGSAIFAYKKVNDYKEI